MEGKVTGVMEIKPLKIICIFALLFLSAVNILSAKELENIPPNIDSPQKVATWFTEEFEYRGEYPDVWQAPSSTLRTKKGDCEDFAILASSALRKIGISSNIAIIKFNGLSTSHAICIWRNKNGKYNFISNGHLYKSKAPTLEGAVEKYYPDWDKIILANTKKEHLKVIRRK